MRHADEGTLHEFIDGSLAPQETAQVEAHLATCGSCRARLADARALVRETADLIVALDAAGGGPATRPASARRRARPTAILGWAASIAMAVGVGFALHGPIRSTGAPTADAIDRPAAPMGARGAVAGAAPARANDAPRDERLRRGSASSRDASAAPIAVRKAATSAAAPPPADSPAAAPEALRMHPSAAVALGTRTETGAHRPDSNSITLEEAVRRLGGSIRLIDGLDPISVARVPGSTVAGADPKRDAVVVRYLDPAFGAVQLAQQRILTADSLDASAPPPDITEPMPRTTQTSRGPRQEEFTALSWKDGHGFQMTLIAAAPVESLAALRARVH
ncbi:MAG: zf-HC2 domain-containing protein [Gemmatimonadales bacterium]